MNDILKILKVNKPYSCFDIYFFDLNIDFIVFVFFLFLKKIFILLALNKEFNTLYKCIF